MGSLSLKIKKFFVKLVYIKVSLEPKLKTDIYDLLGDKNEVSLL